MKHCRPDLCILEEGADEGEADREEEEFVLIEDKGEGEEEEEDEEEMYQRQHSSGDDWEVSGSILALAERQTTRGQRSVSLKNRRKRL